ncbi:TIGR04076 family protein [Chloroflexota bacterium]
MAESYDIAIRVVSQEGTCEAGHEVGGEWLIKGDEFKTPPGVCVFAFYSLYPTIQMLMYGGNFPWESDSDAATVACPDAQNPVVFEVRRIPEA